MSGSRVIAATHKVEADGTVEHLIVGIVRVGALRGSRKVEFAASRTRRSIYERAQLVSKSRHVAYACLEIEIEAVDNRIAEPVQRVSRTPEEMASSSLGTRTGDEQRNRIFGAQTSPKAYWRPRLRQSC